MPTSKSRICWAALFAGLFRSCSSRRGHCALLLTILALPAVAPAAPSGDIWRVCDQAAHRAAQETGVPYDVLRAVSRTETGRAEGQQILPWPWTVNMEGEGRWFETMDAARSYVFKHFKRGARSFDVGCFQINYKWHGTAFRSIDQMFDPVANAEYAAKFLTELYQEFGDWTKAAGAFHSRTPEFADIYTERFEQIRAGLKPSAPGTKVARLSAEVTGPLPLDLNRNAGPLIGRGNAMLGSLVPLAQGASTVPLAQQGGNGSAFVRLK